ncbi:MAG: hypothetical protein Q8M26_06845 [Pseudolabrys sp.]|nr:hypothetical protein [Pseudolabrys sp.]
MKSAQKKPAEELRMSSAEFDRIMGQALQVKPEASKAKSTKKKTSPKKVKTQSK